MTYMFFILLALLFRLTDSQFGGYGGLGGGFHGHPYGVHHPGLYHDPFGGLYHDPFGGFGGGLYHQPVVVQHHVHVVPEQKQRKRQQRQKGMFSSSIVHQLTPQDFPGRRVENFWLVMFHSNKRLSQKAKPVVERLAERVHETLSFKVGAVDCDLHKDFCFKRSPIDFPRFAFLVRGELTFLDDDDVVSAKKLFDFAYRNMQTSGLVKKIQSQEQIWDNFLGKVGKRKKGGIFLLTDKDETSALYYSLAYKYRKDFLFAEASASDKSIREHLAQANVIPRTGVNLPALVAFRQDVNMEGQFTIYHYDRSVKGSELVQWLDLIMKEEPKSEETENGVIQLHGKKDFEVNFVNAIRSKSYGGLIVLSENSKPDPLLQRLVKRYSSKLVFAEDRHANLEIKNMFFPKGIHESLKYPFFTAVVHDGESVHFSWYDGPVQYFAISEWIETTFAFDSIRNITSTEQWRTQFLALAKTASMQGGLFLLTDQEGPTQWFIDLSKRYKEQFVFGESRGANPELLNALLDQGISEGRSYPFLVAFFQKLDETGTYSGRLDAYWYPEGEKELEPASEWIEVTLEEHMTRPLLDPSLKKDPPESEQPIHGDQMDGQKDPKKPKQPIETKRSMDDTSESIESNQNLYRAHGIDGDEEAVEEVENVEAIDPDELEFEDLDETKTNTNTPEDSKEQATTAFDNIEDFDEEADIFLRKIENEKLAPAVLKMAFDKVTDTPIRRLVVSILQILLFMKLMRALLRRSNARFGRAPAWLSDDDLVSGNKSTLSDFTSMILYVHHNYLRIAWYVGVRSGVVLFLLHTAKQMCFQMSKSFGDRTVLSVLRFLGDMGAMAQGLFVLVMAASIDGIEMIHALIGQVAKGSLPRASYSMLFVQPQEVLLQMKKVVGTLLISSDFGKQESHLNPFIFMYLDPFTGGGFHPFHHHGFHHPMMFPHHHIGFHNPAPVVHHSVHHHQISQFPGGLFYDAVAQNEPTGSQQDKAIEDGIMIIVFILSVLVVAPITEEIVFRYVMDCGGKAGGFLRRLMGNANNGPTATTTWFGHDWWVVVCSLIFAAAHLNNHIPTSNGLDALYRRGSDIVEAQLAFALIQFFVTFFLSLRLLSPAYNKTGLVGAMGAHFMWNFCALTAAPQIGLRLLFLVLRYVWRGLLGIMPSMRGRFSQPLPLIRSGTAMDQNELELLRNRRKAKFE